jgi:hypothetical protein
MPTIRIDDEVYAWLQKQARPFEDTPNSVIRRIAGMDEAIRPEPPSIPQARISVPSTSGKTPQPAYRDPILKILKKHGGQADRTNVLRELEDAMKSRFTDLDKRDIKSGSIRWQKTAEWEVRLMRERGLLKAVDETSRGVWALTQKGREAADSLK